MSFIILGRETRGSNVEGKKSRVVGGGIGIGGSELFGQKESKSTCRSSNASNDRPEE